MGSLKIQPNYLTHNRCYIQNKKRTPIGIQIHTIGCAQGTAQAVADYWNQSSADACVTYICDCDEPGKVLKLVDEDVATWADAGYGNRNLITIEICESDFMRYNSAGTYYEVTDNERFVADILRGYDTAVALCADICKRYGWDPLTKLPSGLYLISSHDEGRIAGLSYPHVDPSHIWPKIGLTMDTFRQAVKAAAYADDVIFTEDPVVYYRVRKKWEDVSSQLGAYVDLENAKNACPYLYSVFDPDGKKLYSNKTKPKTGTQASVFQKMTESEAAETMLNLVKDVDTSGIFPSVTTAQMILESGYGKTSLAQSANNCFGMKANLSGNKWDSVWDGKSSVTVPTWEVIDGKTVTTEAEFRKYPDVETSIKDHSAYLLGAMNGSKKRYAGLLDAKNAEAAITIIKEGGYATDPSYISKIMSIVNRYSLDEFDPVKTVEPEEKAKLYRVQIGSYKYKHNAKRKIEAVAEKTKLSTSIVKSDDGMYLVICGSFKNKENAEKRANVLKRRGIDAFVKGVVL